MTGPVVDDRVWVVVYGDEVHTYTGARAEESARTLYTVGLAAFGDDDASIYRVTPQRWADARKQLTGIKIVTH